MNTFERLKKATDHSRNYSDYRQLLKQTSLPCLPFLGLYLTDLTFTDDGNPDTRNNGRLINFDKYVKTARIINDLMCYQSRYALCEVLEIQEYLLRSVDERPNKDPQQLYELSLILEPRESETGRNSGTPKTGSTSGSTFRELEAKIEMLERAGML